MEVTVYSTPTCPWCRRAKAFLAQAGVPYRERDVSVDAAAAQEMVRRSGQRGVPVITVDDQVIVGFDRPRLEQALSLTQTRATAPPRLGAAVADAATRSPQQAMGAYVGKVTPGTPAARSGITAGDIITRIAGQPITSAADVERVRARLKAGTAVPVEVRRAGVPRQLSLHV